MQHASGPQDGGGFLSTLVPRLPRMMAVTAVVMFSTFAGIQFIPQTFEAQLALRLPAGSAADVEAGKIIDQENLGEIVSRLSPDIVAELRRNGGGVLDTTALLHQRLVLRAAEDGQNLDLSARAGTPARARAIVDAVVARYAEMGGMPPALPAAASVTAAPAAATAPKSGQDVGTLEQKLSLAWEDRIKLENRAGRVNALIADGNYAMLALDAENLPGLGRQIDELATLEAERERLALKFLPNHPTMRTLKDEIDTLSGELSGGVQQLAQLVTADRDAARRLEDGLRDELAAAKVPVAVDTSVMTASIDAPSEAVVTALPRPVRTDLALAFAGGLAFFGQVGLLALLRQRRTQQVEFVAETAEPTLSPVEEEDLPPEPAVVEIHNWIDSAALAPVSVAPNWIDAVEDISPAPVKAETPAIGLDESRVVAIHCRGDLGAGARKLLAHYERQRKRVVLVDAASRRRGRAAGISDLALGHASFADIIHGSGSHEAALVPWGRQAQLDPSAKPVRILIGALAELYDVVVITIDSDNLRASAPLVALADISIEADAVPVGRAAA